MSSMLSRFIMMCVLKGWVVGVVVGVGWLSGVVSEVIVILLW